MALRNRVVITCLALALTVLTLAGCATGTAGPLQVTYVTNSSATTVELSSDPDDPTIHVFSETGIGAATFHVDDTETATIVDVRLHLNGLEQFEFAFGDVVISASVESYGDHVIRQFVSLSGAQPVQIDEASEYWLQIVPSVYQNGVAEYFDVRPPAALATGGPGNFTLSWIDFYR